MRKSMKLAMCVLASVFFVGSFAACGKTPDGSGEKIDSNKTQLYVFNYNGGYKTDWLESAKNSYQELHKNDSYEDGKTGVQIIINHPKSFPSSSEILAGDDEVYFDEGIFYRQFLNAGVFADLTSIVTEKSGYDGKTIESKLTEQQIKTLKVDGKYYAIPHYSGGYGLIYNRDLFDEQGWYFRKTPLDSSLEGRFVMDDAEAERSLGPDGKVSDDDGLPATYDEFFALCELIVENQMTPVCWSGSHYNLHLNGLMNALVADYEGVDRMNLRMSFDGEADDLGKIENGNFVKDAMTQISKENGYEVFRQEGVYHALTFIEKLIKTKNFHNDNAFSTYSQNDAQDEFLLGGIDGRTKEVAMLVDGDWWQQEADDSFSSISEDYGKDKSKFNRHFAWMPLPKATQEKVGSNSTDYDTRLAFGFICKKTSAKKMPLALDFLQYVNSDDMLADFTKTTNTLKALNYSVSNEILNEMTPYGRSLYQAKKSGTTDYTTFMSDSAVFINNQTSFDPQKVFKGYNGTEGNAYLPAEAFHDQGMSAETYFNGLYAYWKKQWESINK